ncbi:MAG: DNA gyrase inhibitor YacG [Rhodocyclaceae bacterium]|nr:DNA gyrase inhibitor YacG [Rhodocyclaceae bacterium]
MSASNTPTRTVKCPTCGQTVAWRPESAWRPFCSQRCRQIDLGAWASESYRIPAAMPPEPGEDLGDD